MKKELDYFSIDGVQGGSQDWMSNFLMKFGGCAALAACDTCIYLAAKQGWKQIYPYNIAHLCREDYDRFAMKMKPYLRPRIGDGSLHRRTGRTDTLRKSRRSGGSTDSGGMAHSVSDLEAQGTGI